VKVSLGICFVGLYFRFCGWRHAFL